MIGAALDYDQILAEVRAAYRAQRLPGVVVPGLLPDAGADRLRRALRAAGLTPYALATRGRYQFNEELVDLDLFDQLRDLAERIAETRLAVGAARWCRLARGDYSLVLDDRATRLERGQHLEVTVDFSAGSSAGGEVVYTDGKTSLLEVPQWGGSVALVERAPEVRRYERYLTHRVGDAEVFRLRLALAVLS